MEGETMNEVMSPFKESFLNDYPATPDFIKISEFGNAKLIEASLNKFFFFLH